MLFLPKTPQFLMMQKKDAQAEAIIKKLKLSTNVRQTMADIRISLTEESSDRLCQSENNMNGRMFIGIGLVVAQQLTGQPNTIYYTSDVFKAVGFCSEFSSTLASVGLGILSSYGICFFLGFSFSPLHNFIPFLLLGLGNKQRGASGALFYVAPLNR